MSENEVTIQVINNYLNNYLNKTPESTEINKSPTLTSTEHAFTLTFDSTQCPTLTLDFDDAEQFSINCVSAKNAHLVRVFTSEEDGKSMIQSKDSVVTFECRCFETDLKNFKLEFQVVSEKESLKEVIGNFEFDFKKISQGKNNSQGRLKLDVKNGSAVCGKIACTYLHVKSFLTNDDCMKSHDYWSSEKQLRGGHRGSGNSFTGKVLSDIRENTIDSFRAAFDGGKADFVEFDVTITKDQVPVVYHDLGLAIDGNPTTINRQTSVALHEACKTSPKTRVQHLSEIDGRAGDLQFDVSKPWEMPDLRDMFLELPVKLGFNLEVKWPTVNIEMKSENMLGARDADWFDMNEYVDQILGVVMKDSGERELIFSCFDPNVCYCLQLKQSKYPVMQLTCGDSKHYTDLIDLRIRRNATAIKWAAHVGYLAINTLAKDVLEDKYDLVDEAHAAGLKLFVYGDDMQNPEVLKKLKSSGLDALVYDVIHQVQ